MQIDKYGNYSGINSMNYWGMSQRAARADALGQRVWRLEAALQRIADQTTDQEIRDIALVAIEGDDQ